MTRYAAGPKLVAPNAYPYVGDDWWSPKHTSIDVICVDRKPVDTGLLDADGRTLYRLPPSRPIGFTSRWEE